MKKKLISFDAFKQIENNSVSNAEKELVEASEMLAKVLGKEKLDLHCINETNVTFMNQDGNLVQADYSFDGEKILLDNITELVLDEASVNTSSKGILESMIDNILDDKLEEASADFSKYFSIPMLRSSMREGTINEATKSKKGKIPPQFLKNIKKMKDKHGKKDHDDNGDEKETKFKKRKADGKVAECMKKPTVEALNLLANNVLEYVDFMENGNIFQNIRTQKDNAGDVVAVEIPSTKLRNEGKVHKMHMKASNAKVKEGRSCAMEATNSANWIRAVNDLKRFNALSDHTALQNAFENVAAAWPNLLFLTSGELASKINTTLENSGATNYDSDTCAFLAEGILRTAHRAFSEHVGKVFNMAGMPLSEDFNDFVAASDKVIPMINAEEENTMQVFSDLYRGLYEVYRTAEKLGDAYTKAEVGSMIYNVADILNKKQPVDLQVAEDAASYLKSLSEAISLDGAEWKVDSPHVSLVGDNPAIHSLASVDGNPASHPGKFKGSPVSDGKSVKVDVEDHYTAMKGKDLYPDMGNPYAPKPGEFKMHGEKAPEDDKDLTSYKGPDTFPNMKNPYIPANGMTMQDTLRHLVSSK